MKTRRPDLLDRSMLTATIAFFGRHLLRLAPIFIGASLLSDLLMASIHLGTLHHGFHSEEALPYARPGALSPLPLLIVLFAMLFVLTASFVVTIGTVAQLDQTGRIEPRKLLTFLRRRFTSGLRGFWSGLWRALLVMLGIVILGTLAINLVADLGSAALRDVLPLLATIGAVAVALPSILATFLCVLDDAAFDAALGRMQSALKGRRKRVLLTLAAASLPLALLAGFDGQSPLTACLLLAANALASIPPTVLLYRYARAFAVGGSERFSSQERSDKAGPRQETMAAWSSTRRS